MWVKIRDKVWEFVRRPAVAKLAIVLASALVEVLAERLRQPRLPRYDEELPYE